MIWLIVSMIAVYLVGGCATFDYFREKINVTFLESAFLGIIWPLIVASQFVYSVVKKILES